MLKDVGVLTTEVLAPGGPPERPLLVCFSHLRWDFVFQRPQHLMTRFARTHEVHVWEEPIFNPAPAAPRVEARVEAPGLTVATPHLVEGMVEEAVEAALCALLDDYLGTDRPQVAWYYTPMMLPFSRHLEADCTVYDCMDELANFRFAPPRLTSPISRRLAVLRPTTSARPSASTVCSTSASTSTFWRRSPTRGRTGAS
jgi:hypothetical protein